MQPVNGRVTNRIQRPLNRQSSDSSTMYIPAEWTNVGSVKTKEVVSSIDKLRSRNISSVSVSDLLRMRLVVDALLKCTSGNRRQDK
jgi:hypothetical protein